MLSKVLLTNEHPVERIARVAIGLFGLSLVFMGPRTPWGYIGFLPLLTGLVGTCPLYTLLGVSTCARKEP